MIFKIAKKCFVSHCKSKLNLRFITNIAVMILLISTQATCSDNSEKWISHEQLLMGTTFRISISHKDKNIAKMIIDSVVLELNRIENTFSPYIQDSEISQVNRNASNSPINISSELFYLVDYSLNISKITNGTFDITYASIGSYYNFRKKTSPNTKIISSKLQAINYKHIVLNKNYRTIFFKDKDVKIDLGGFAKGYAVDKAIAILQRENIINASVSIGGDSKIIGTHHGKPWRVGVKTPDTNMETSVILNLTNSAISTSGNYERFFIKNGQRIHHIINPNTGEPAKNIKSVTIIGNNGIFTDALSTSTFILGVEKGIKLIESIENIEAVIIDSDDIIHKSSGIKKLENANKSI